MHSPAQDPHISRLLESSLHRQQLPQPERLGPEGRLLRYRDLPCERLQGPRDLYVYLPRGYHPDRAQDYGRAVFMDGANVFDFVPRDQGSQQKWGVESAADSLTNSGHMRPSVLIGVCNGRGEFARHSELSITSDPDPGISLLGPAHAAYLVHDFFPLLDTVFPSSTQREHKLIAGSSYGADFALYFGLQYPEVFGKVAALSPSLRITINAHTTLIAAKVKPDTAIWVDSGQPEQGHAYLPQLSEALRNAGWKPGYDLLCLSVPDHRHQEQYWRLRIPEVLRRLLPSAAIGNQ